MRGRKRSEDFKMQIAEMRVHQAHLASEKRRKMQIKQRRSPQRASDGHAVNDQLLINTFDMGSAGDDNTVLENIKIKNLNMMHKTAVDKSPAGGPSQGGHFPKLPGLGMKDSGDVRQPVSSRG